MATETQVGKIGETKYTIIDAAFFLANIDLRSRSKSVPRSLTQFWHVVHPSHTATALLATRARAVIHGRDGRGAAVALRI